MAQDSREVMLLAMQGANENKRRVTASREQVARMEHELALARERLNVDEAEYKDAGQFMREVWSYFRSEIERIPVKGCTCVGVRDEECPTHGFLPLEPSDTEVQQSSSGDTES